MLFNSLSFVFFLIIIFTLYWGVPHKYRWIPLLAANYYFYMSWGAKYIVLLLFITLLSYLTGLILEKQQNRAKKNVVLCVSIVLSLSALFFYKYFGFFMQNVQTFLSIFAIQFQPSTIRLMLPVGISFYTFQTLGYVIDVYRGTISAEHHFGKYASFVAFFPVVTSGPIARAKDLLTQIKEERVFDYYQATYGLKLMAWGFFKKLVIADTLATYVNKVFNDPYGHIGFTFVLASLFYTIQIYCDFSGYSDIAIGISKLLGIDLRENFRSPYFSSSVKEFWSRWHISLSSWFRDYVYIPLGGNRKGTIRAYFNLVITFFVSGLWHGANWTFIAWGLIHGLAQVAEKICVPKENKSKDYSVVWLLRVLVVFSFCSFAWIFFRANCLSDARYIITHLFNGISNPGQYILHGFSSIGLSNSKIIMPVISIIILTVYDFFSLKMDVIERISSRSIVIRYAFYFGILLLVMFFKASGEAVFVYFQF